MKITFDPNKRNKTLEERGLDFLGSEQVFAGKHFTVIDTRFDYGETRYISIGKLDKRMVVVVWTQRGNARHIISMRKANEREQKRYHQYLD